MNVYLIPGLGSDKRMYKSLLEVLPNAKVIEFIRPYYGETLEEYAQRMALGIDNSVPFSLVGTSLGGMIAVEISKILQPEKIVLIASAKSRNELPLFLRSLSVVKLHKLFRAPIVTKTKERKIKRIVSDSNAELKTLLLEMNKDADPLFIEWAGDAVIHWKGEANYRKDIIHFHGTKDGLFPIKRIENCIPIIGATHFMALNLGEELKRKVEAVFKN
jgi:pimeloyl-ACP methyl ester carboxylesterase